MYVRRERELDGIVLLDSVLHVEAMADGNWAMMPAKMIREMPLPTPRAVICSPSHIRNIVPPTRVITVLALKNSPADRTTLCPAVAVMPSNPAAMPQACNAVKITVP